MKYGYYNQRREILKTFGVLVAAATVGGLISTGMWIFGAAWLRNMGVL